MARKPLMVATSVTVDCGGDADGSPWYWVKLQTDAFELNVGVRPDEVARFERVRSTPWVKGALHIGVSAGARAFWCASEGGDESISVLVGDDESWDLAVHLPAETIDVMRREIAACPLEGGGA